MERIADTDKSRVFIIAEAGVNHDGDMSVARDMVFCAKEIGADAIKFQTFCPESLVTPSLGLASYQRAAFGYENHTQLEMLRKLVLTEADFFELKDLCGSVGIEFMSTAFDEESLVFLSKLGVARYKIPSGELTNRALIKATSKNNGHLYMSTGMATLSEVVCAVSWAAEVGRSIADLTVMHCTSLYPAPAETVNLRAIKTLSECLNIGIGYSDHTLTSTASLGAVAMGARAIEKHFTLDRNRSGPDHKASMLPSEFHQMVQAIRELEVQLGSGEKMPVDSELQSRITFRKSVHASRVIRAGDLFSYDNLCLLRPGNGVQPALLDSLIGTQATRDYGKFEQIDG